MDSDWAGGLKRPFAFVADDGSPITLKELREASYRTGYRERFLYRFFNENDELLYVGVAWNLGYRFAQHRQKKPWWNEVQRIWIELYQTDEACLAAEREAIQTEGPKYNIVWKRPA